MAAMDISEPSIIGINSCVYKSTTQGGLEKLSDCGSPSCPNSDANKSKK